MLVQGAERPLMERSARWQSRIGTMARGTETRGRRSHSAADFVSVEARTIPGLQRTAVAVRCMSLEALPALRCARDDRLR